MIKASVLLLAMLCVSPALRRRSAAERHFLWVVAIGLAALLPLFTLALPAWEPEFARRAAQALPGLSGAAGLSDPGDADVIVRAAGVDSPGTSPVQVLIGIWLCGLGVAAWRLVTAGMKLSRLRAAARPVTDSLRRSVLEEVSQRLGIDRSVRLLESTERAVPITWGFLSPSVLLPADASSWSQERLRVVLTHELAHVSRGDWCVQLAAKTVCALYWFNPLFWLACGRLCRESEQACDDAVLRFGVDSHEYAQHLFEIARRSTMKRDVAPALAMATSNLERRFAALLRADSNRRALTAPMLWAVPSLTMMLVLPLAAVTIPAADATIAIRTANLPTIPESSAIPTDDMTVLAAIRDVRADDPRSRDVEAVMSPVVLEYTRPPLYSDEGRRQQIEGVVTLAVRIDSTGHAEVQRLVKGLGFGLDQNAILALRTWRFAPAQRLGRPIDSVGLIDVRFSLANEAINELIANDMATRVGQGVLPPRIVRRVAFRHDRGTRVSVRSGVVVLDVVLLEDGTPKVVRIVHAVDPLLDQEAVRTFEQWRFSPAVKDGVPVKVRMNADVSFHVN